METFLALLAICEGSTGQRYRSTVDSTHSDAEIWSIIWSVLKQTVE